MKPEGTSKNYGCVQPGAMEGGASATNPVDRREAQAGGRAVGPRRHGSLRVHAGDLRRPRGDHAGAGGEIQLTDAISLLLETQPVFGYAFKTGRFDVGNKLDFLRATVELALDRPDLGEEFKAFLADLVQRRKLV